MAGPTVIRRQQQRQHELVASGRLSRSSKKQQQQQQYQTTITTTTATAGKLSPRADLWAYLFVSSTATTATLSMSSSRNSTLETATIAVVSLALIIALFVAFEFRFQPSRDRLTKPFSKRGLGKRSTMELILAVLALVLWCFTMGVVVNAQSYHLGVEGLAVGHANLFYSTWISFAITCYLVADLLTIDDLNGVLPYYYEASNQASRSWVLLLIASLVLLSFNLAIGKGEICSGSGDLLQGTTACQYTISGVVFAFAGILASLAYLLVERTFPSKSKSPGIFLSLFATVSFAINAGLSTSPGAAGSEPSNLYWSSWVCFALSFYLCMCHVDMYMESRTSTTTDDKSVQATEYVPLVQQNVPVVQEHVPVQQQHYGGVSSGGSTTSASTYSSTNDDDETSSSETTETESEFDLLLPRSQRQAKTNATSMQTGGTVSTIPAFLQADRNRIDQQKIQQQRTMNQKSIKAREEKKQHLFDEMNRGHLITHGAVQRKDTARVLPKAAAVAANDTASGFENNEYLTSNMPFYWR